MQPVEEASYLKDYGQWGTGEEGTVGCDLISSMAVHPIPFQVYSEHQGRPRDSDFQHTKAMNIWIYLGRIMACVFQIGPPKPKGSLDFILHGSPMSMIRNSRFQCGMLSSSGFLSRVDKMLTG